MKMLASALAGLFVLAGVTMAQGDMQKNFDEKMAKDFVKKVTWQTSIKDALAVAKKDSKLVFGYFTRSYAP